MGNSPSLAPEEITDQNLIQISIYEFKNKQ